MPRGCGNGSLTWLGLGSRTGVRTDTRLQVLCMEVFRGYSQWDVVDICNILLQPVTTTPTRTTTTTQAFHPDVAIFVSPICETSAVDMMNVDGAGAATWRCERRLRSWLRHEWMTVAAELPAALHHSRDGVRVTHDGPRAQKTVSSVVRDVEAHETNDTLRRQKELPPGARPGILAE